MTDYSDFTDTDAPVRARGNSYAELMRRQAKLDLTDPSVLSNLDQDDADEYLETYAGVEGSTDDDKNFAGKGSYSPQRSKLSAIPSDHYIVAGDGSDDDDGDIEVVDADDDVEGELADKTRSIEAAEDSDDDDCDVVEEEVDEPAAESLPAPIDDGDDDDDCEVVEATDEITELTTELSGASLQETPPPVEPVEVLEEVKENEKESPNAVTTYRLQCSGQKVPVRSAPHPHAEVLRYLYSGTRIRAHALTIAGFFQLANGGVSFFSFYFILD